MNFYPNDLPERLEFDKIIALLKKECLGERGKTVFDQISFSTDKKEILELLQEVYEFKYAIEEDDPVPLSTYETIENDLPLLLKDGYVLDIEAIQRIHRLILSGKELSVYYADYKRQKSQETLFSIASVIDIDPNLLKSIEKVIDPEGNIRPDASEALLKIQKKINNRERELDKVFVAAVSDAKKNGFLADTSESMRNGRRVLTVLAEHKRKIRGVIHDESATGKTVFIEPEPVMMINNAIFNLYTDRKKEVYKILKSLCDQLRPHASALSEIENVIVKLDTVRSKARLAIQIDAKKPNLIGKPNFGFKLAFNPVLYLKNKKEGKVTVPFDLELVGQNRLLVLSGPNAGGKSITMKSVGLIQLMLQSGMLVPVDENSKMGIFKKIFTDIGDQQSIEDDLSTYSSRLRNMKTFLERTDKESLILIDEFGSGTDPKIGGAIAEAILRELNFKKCYGVVTTHYSNIKYFAFRTPGILNGSMEFDKKEIKPTYSLKVGSPGSSFAFEIATNSGLSDKVIRYAKKKTGKNEKAIDEMLVDLQTERQELSEKMHKLMVKEDKIDKLIANYNELHRELEYRRKKLKLERKESKLSQVSNENKELRSLIREIKNAKTSKEVQKVEKAFAKQKKEQQSVAEEVKQLKEEVFYQSQYKESDFKEGMFVRMRTGDTSGKIKTIKKGVAEIEMGFLTFSIPLRDLVPASAPIDTNSTKSVNTEQVAGKGNFETKLDVRGYTKSDARDFIQEFLDLALINNASQLRIVHGKGNGILRKVVHQKLKEYKDVKEIWHPNEEFGGEGVTIVRL